MKNKSIENVLKVWETENNIRIPSRKIQLDVIDQIASMFAIGTFYYFVFNFETLEMDLVSEGINDVLGIESTDYVLQTYFDLMHPEVLAKLNEKEEVGTDFLFNHIKKNDIPYYKVTYLIKAKHSSGKYKTLLHQSRAINISEGGKIQQVLTIHTDITNLSIPFTDNVSFIGHGRKSYYAIKDGSNYSIVESKIEGKFSFRQTEIIARLAKGKSSKEIAKELSITVHTTNTHKKNILRKAECKNTAELVGKCIIEGVI